MNTDSEGEDREREAEGGRKRKQDDTPDDGDDDDDDTAELVEKIKANDREMNGPQPRRQASRSKTYYESGDEQEDGSPYRQATTEEDDDDEIGNDKPPKQQAQSRPQNRPTKRPQRVRKVKELDYSCMEKNDDGYVEISRHCYKPEEAVTDAMVMRTLGDRGRQLQPEDFNRVWDFFEQLKLQAAIFTRERIKKEILKNKPAESTWSTVKDIQTAWKNVIGENIKPMGRRIDNMLVKGYFKSPEWPVDLERETLEHFKLKYLPSDAESQLLLGCFNLQANRSMADIRKYIWKEGKKTHGFIVTRRRENYKEGEAKQKSKENKSRIEFKDDFLRKPLSRMKKKRKKFYDVYKVCPSFACESFRPTRC